MAKILKTIAKPFAAALAWLRLRHIAVRIIICASLSLIALLLIGIAALSIWIRPPERPEIVLNAPQTTAETSESSERPERPPNNDEAEAEGYALRDGVFTFMLAGVHETLTDTLMVATLDTERMTCYILSIPRDTFIESAPRNVRKINGAFSQRRGVEEPGMTQLKSEIATLIGYRPQYGAVVDYRAVVQLVDAVGGVEFDVPMRMHVPREGINLQRGVQRLNGRQAMQLLRFRYNPATGVGYDDYGRMQTAQRFLAAAIDAALADWTNILEYLRIARENLISDDLDWGHMFWFAARLREIGMENVVFNSLPTVSSGHRNSYENIISEEALELINQTINPFNIPIGEELVEHGTITRS